MNTEISIFPYRFTEKKNAALYVNKCGSMKIALTGGGGRLGNLTVKELSKIKGASFTFFLHNRNSEGSKDLMRLVKKKRLDATFVRGDLVNIEDARSLVEGADYVINMAGVIPPLSEKNPRLSSATNEFAVQNLVSVIEKMERRPKFIDISSVAVYGSRTMDCAWGNTGDPAMGSPYDVYSANKIRSEFALLESEVKRFVILRYTAMIYKALVDENLATGLMFPTLFHGSLEWCSGEDAARLLRKIVEKDSENDRLWL